MVEYKEIQKNEKTGELEEVMVAKERPYDLVVSKYYLPGDE
jgi:hypothetical protein